MSDLLSRLRSFAPDGDTMPRTRTAMLEAADRIEALAVEVERLTKRLDLLAVGFGVPDGGRYIADWEARIAKFKKADVTERALAEAVEIMRPVADLSTRYDDTVSDGWVSWIEFITDHAWPTETECKAARDFITAQEKEKGK